jgi:hypothetical protein
MEAGTRQIRLRRGQATTDTLRPHLYQRLSVVRVDQTEVHGQLVELSADSLTVVDFARQGFARKPHRHVIPFTQVEEVNVVDPAGW